MFQLRLAAFALAISFGCQRSQVRDVSADLHAPATLDFGLVAEGAEKTLALTVSSTSATGLELLSARTAAPFSVADRHPSSSSVTLQIAFAPPSEGAAQAALTLAFDTGTVTVQLLGQGYLPQVRLDATQLDFGAVTVGASKTLTFSVTNAAPVALAARVDAEAGSGAFAAAPGDLGTLAPSQAATVSVTFAPSVAGPASGALDVSCDGCALQHVALTGNGIAAAGPPPAPAALQVTPAQLLFALQLPGVLPAQTLTVENTGDLPLSWSAALDGSELLLSTSAGSLDGHASAQVSVSLAAAAAMELLRHVTFTATAASPIAPVVVPVTLQITAAPPLPALLVEPTSLALSAQLPDLPVAQGFRIHNTGGGTLHWTVGGDASGLLVSPLSGSTEAGAFSQVLVGAASVPLFPLTFSRTLGVATVEAGAASVSVSVTFTPSPPPPQYGGSVWPKFHQGNSCTGLSSVRTATRGHLRFRSAFGPARMSSTDGTYVGSPSLAADGTVYQLGGDGFNGTLTAFDPKSGGARWNAAVTSPAAISPSIESTPTVVKDGSVFVVTGAESASTHFYKFDAAGDVLWQEPDAIAYGDGFDSSPAIGADGTLWMAWDDGPDVILFSQSGPPHEISRVSLESSDIESQSAAISDDGIGYWSDDGILRVMTAAGMLWTHDARDGQFQWVHSRSAPLLTPDGKVVFAWANTDFDTGAVTTTVTAVSAGRGGGARLWQTAIGPTLPVVSVGPSSQNDLADRVGLSSPAMGPDGTIYIGHADGLYALDKDSGAVHWHAASALVASSPAVGADGSVFYGAMDGVLRAVSPAGSLLWSVPTGGQVNTSPAIGADGAVFFASDDGFLYAVE